MLLLDYCKNFDYYISTIVGVLQKNNVDFIDNENVFQSSIRGYRDGNFNKFCIDGLNIQLRRDSSICSNGSGKMSIFVDFNMTVDLTKDNILLAIKTYSLNIHAKSLEKKKFCWHLDQHGYLNNENVSHPRYHLHAGGNFIEPGEEGNILLFKTPRIAHPPLDPLLIIHFILTNFFEKKVYGYIDNILNDQEYTDIMVVAESLFWRPYFSALSYEPAAGGADLFKALFPMHVG